MKQSILVIDDNLDMLTLQRTLLEFEGFEVFTANGASAAFKEICLVHNKLNLILLDVRMEEMSGLDFLVMLGEKLPNVIKSVPVVFLTGMDEIPKSAALGYIRKGNDAIEFLAAVHRFIEMGQQVPYTH